MYKSLRRNANALYKDKVKVMVSTMSRSVLLPSPRVHTTCRNVQSPGYTFQSYKTTPRTVLLDFDGVIFKNQRAMKKVEEASAHFCRLHMKNVSLEFANEFNRMYYQKYGHTVNMLRHLTGANVSLEEFNDFVYNHFINYEQMKNMITPEDIEHAKMIEAFITRIRKDGGVCEVFTNGSSTWVQRINELVGMNEDVVNRLAFSCCENLPELKPSPKAYKYVESRLKKIEAPSPYYFIDDSRRNLVYCEKTNTSCNTVGPTWIPILYENNNSIFEVL